eukprot:g3768.t1 g3768   contig13:117173-118091(+)
MSKRTRDAEDEGTTIDDEHPPLTLPHIKIRIQQLIGRLPSKEETAALKSASADGHTGGGESGGSASEAAGGEKLDNWCRIVRGILRDYNLVLNFVAIATYQWEPDRPGHTGQSLAALKNQIQSSTARTNIVSNDISRILTPTLSRQLTKKRIILSTTTTTNNNNKPDDSNTMDESNNTETKEEIYTYEQIVSDPEVLQLNREQLCAEAIYKRQLVVSTMEQMCTCLDDYGKAEIGASDHKGGFSSMAY